MIITDCGWFAFFFSGLVNGIDFLVLESAVPPRVGNSGQRVYDRCEFVRDLARAYEMGFGRYPCGESRHPGLGRITIERELVKDAEHSPFVSDHFMVWRITAQEQECTFLCEGWQPRPALNTQIVDAGPIDRKPPHAKIEEATRPQVRRVGPQSKPTKECPVPF